MIRRHSLRAFERLVVATVFCVSILMLTGQAFAAAFVAQAVKVRGDVRIERDGGNMSCSMGTAFQLGDVIKTGKDARLRLRFTDGSILVLGENTTLSVDLYAVDATNKSRTVVLTVLQGIVNAAAAKSGESKFDYQIKTANGYSAVRGTKWLVSFQQALMNVYVLNGIVEMGTEGAPAPPVMVNAGQWGSVDASGAVSPPKPTTPEMLKPVLDATADTAGGVSVPTTPQVPLPTLPLPTVPLPPTNNNKTFKNDNRGGVGNNGGGDHYTK